jgi:hypothetical protein
MKYFVTLESFCISDDFICDIRDDFDVIAYDVTNAPYAVVYVGTMDNLKAMIAEHWTDDIVPVFTPYI